MAGRCMLPRDIGPSLVKASVLALLPVHELLGQIFRDRAHDLREEGGGEEGRGCVTRDGADGHVEEDKGFGGGKIRGKEWAVKGEGRTLKRPCPDSFPLAKLHSQHEQGGVWGIKSQTGSLEGGKTKEEGGNESFVFPSTSIITRIRDPAYKQNAYEGGRRIR